MKKADAQQIEILRSNAHRVVKLECGFCDDEGDADSVEELYKEGWRSIESKEYEAIGIACPTCASTVK